MLNATLIKRIDVTPELVIFRIKPDVPPVQFLPGQYVAIGLYGAAPRPADFPAENEIHAADKLIKRAYSIGSSPYERDVLEFYVAIVPTGALTSRLVMLKEGDRLYVAPKVTGTFTLGGVSSGSELVLVSTGTGLAPYISMLRSPEVWQLADRIVVLHGVRYQKDLGYRDELFAWERAFPQRFRYFPVVSRDDGSIWTGEKGHVQRLFTEEKIQLRADKQHIFVCGNPAMVDELQRLATERGFKEHSKKSPGNFHVEKYW